MHKHVTADQLRNDLTLIEEQAMMFAGAFLLPGGAFASDVQDLTLDAFADVKPHWMVSIGAMIKRARSLDMISADYERNLWKYYSYRKWRGNEPHDENIPVETPFNLKAAIEMVAEDGTAELSLMLEDIGLAPEYLQQLAGVSGKLFETTQKERPKLTVVRGGGDRPVPQPAND
jgi:Zn-dependent peptidase ImmA (M78 family)